jgi:hypothetical protein
VSIAYFGVNLIALSSSSEPHLPSRVTLRPHGLTRPSRLEKIALAYGALVKRVSRTMHPGSENAHRIAETTREGLIFHETVDCVCSRLFSKAWSLLDYAKS